MLARLPSRSSRSLCTALAACGLAAVTASGCSRPARLAADLVVTRANVWTGDPLRPTLQAIAVIGDRIADVGSSDDIERWRARLRAVKRALEHAASLGVTSIQDMTPSYDDVAVYADLANRRELTVRIYEAPPDTVWYDQAKLGLRRAFGSPWLRLGAIHGVATTRLPEEQRTGLMAADHAGLQICLDAQRAGGASAALDLAEELIRTDGDRNRRFRVQHAEEASARDVTRFAALKVVASIDASSPEQFARFTSSAAATTIGSDWPASPLNPLLNLAQHAALKTVPVALAAYTSGSAFAEFQDSEKGTNVFTIPPARIKDVRVLTTVAGGRVVHQRNP